jgi:hypothetical protein
MPSTFDTNAILDSHAISREKGAARQSPGTESRSPKRCEYFEQASVIRSVGTIDLDNSAFDVMIVEIAVYCNNHAALGIRERSNLEILSVLSKAEP